LYSALVLWVGSPTGLEITLLLKTTAINYKRGAKALIPASAAGLLLYKAERMDKKHNIKQQQPGSQ